MLKILVQSESFPAPVTALCRLQTPTLNQNSDGSLGDTGTYLESCYPNAATRLQSSDHPETQTSSSLSASSDHWSTPIGILRSPIVMETHTCYWSQLLATPVDQALWDLGLGSRDVFHGTSSCQRKVIVPIAAPGSDPLFMQGGCSSNGAAAGTNGRGNGLIVGTLLQSEKCSFMPDVISDLNAPITDP
jgi:hypothetical protein